MPTNLKFFCLVLFLVCQFLLLVNYVNGFVNFGSVSTSLSKQINEEKNNKSNLQSNLGQQINKDVKQDQSLGAIERIVNIQKITEFPKQTQSFAASTSQSESQQSSIQEQILIIK